MSGPPPKPIQLKLLEGNPSGRRIKRQPQPTKGAPTCPRWLDAEAREEWRRIVPELERLGLLTKIDRAALSIYCESWARWRQVEGMIDAEGVLAEGTKGAKVSALISVSNRYARIMKQYLSDFGLTPASRARLSVPVSKDDNEDLLFGKVKHSVEGTPKR